MCNIFCVDVLSCHCTTVKELFYICNISFRELLWTLSKSELYQLELALCSSEQISTGQISIDSPTLMKAYAQADSSEFIAKFYQDHPECEDFINVIYSTVPRVNGSAAGSVNASQSNGTVVDDFYDEQYDDDDDDDDIDSGTMRSIIPDSDSQEDFIAAQNFIAMQESFSEVLENVIEGKIIEDSTGKCPQDSGHHSDYDKQDSDERATEVNPVVFTVRLLPDTCDGENDEGAWEETIKENRIESTVSEMQSVPLNTANCDIQVKLPEKITSDQPVIGAELSGCDTCLEDRRGKEIISLSQEEQEKQVAVQELAESAKMWTDPEVVAEMANIFDDLVTEEAIDIVYSLFLGDVPSTYSPATQRRKVEKRLHEQKNDTSNHFQSLSSNSKIRNFFPAPETQRQTLSVETGAVPKIQVVPDTPSPDYSEGDSTETVIQATSLQRVRPTFVRVRRVPRDRNANQEFTFDTRCFPQQRGAIADSSRSSSLVNEHRTIHDTRSGSNDLDETRATYCKVKTLPPSSVCTSDDGATSVVLEKPLDPAISKSATVETSTGISQQKQYEKPRELFPLKARDVNPSLQQESHVTIYRCEQPMQRVTEGVSFGQQAQLTDNNRNQPYVPRSLNKSVKQRSPEKAHSSSSSASSAVRIGKNRLSGSSQRVKATCIR